MSGDGRELSVLVGRVVGVFGLRGDVKVAASVLELQAGLRVLARAPGKPERALTVRMVRPAPAHLRVLFDGVDNADAAERLRGMTLHAALADLPPLPANAYREAELVGMRVHDVRLGELGVVPGAWVKMIQHGCPMLIQVGESRICLRREDAKRIGAQVLPAAVS